MNAQPQVLPQPANLHPLPPPGPPSEHRGRSKISRLPKKVRDHLNQMLADGVEYEDIKTNLGEYGKDLTIDEFARHPNAHLLWQTAQARITWNGDILTGEEILERERRGEVPHHILWGDDPNIWKPMR